MPLKIVFLRPQNWSRLKPCSKALLPPLMCNWHVRRKYPIETPELHKRIPTRKPRVTDVLCNWENSKNVCVIILAQPRPSYETKKKLRESKNGSIQKRSPRGPSLFFLEGALGDLCGTDFEGVLGRALLFLRGFWGTCGGVARGLAGDL